MWQNMITLSNNVGKPCRFVIVEFLHAFYSFYLPLYMLVQAATDFMYSLCFSSVLLHVSSVVAFFLTTILCVY